MSLSALHFTSVVSKEKLNLIEYWKSEAIAKQSLPFELPRPQLGGISRWVCTLPAWEKWVLKHICLYGPPGICSGTAECPPAAVQINWGQECL